MQLSKEGLELLIFCQVISNVSKDWRFKSSEPYEPFLALIRLCAWLDTKMFHTHDDDGVTQIPKLFVIGW